MTVKVDIKSHSEPNSLKTRSANSPKWNNAVSGAEEQYQLKREAVIAEASRAFGRKGYKNVSLDEIAAALNVTKPALYYYFKNKQELVYECHELAMQLGDRALRDSMSLEITGIGRIVAFIKNYISMLTDEMGAPAILQDFSGMSTLHQKKIIFRRRQFDHKLREIIVGGIQDGSIAPCNEKMAVFWFMGAVSTIPQWLNTDGSLTSHEVAEIFSEFVANGIRSKADK